MHQNSTSEMKIPLFQHVKMHYLCDSCSAATAMVTNVMEKVPTNILVVIAVSINSWHENYVLHATETTGSGHKK